MVTVADAEILAGERPGCTCTKATVGGGSRWDYAGDVVVLIEPAAEEAS